MTLREAKQEVWKKWRQSKGRRKNNPKTKNKNNNKNNTNEELEAKLEKIEMAVQSYKSELENMKKSEQEKASRLERKRRLESHWEMLRWITSFMEENETKWTELKKLRRQEREEKERKEEWESRTREEKMSMIKEEEAEKLKSKMTNKEGRFEEAQRLKRSWREWRGEGELHNENEWELDPESDNDFLENTDFCLNCAMSPCSCLGNVLDRRIEMIRLEDEIRNLERQVVELDQKNDQNSPKDQDSTTTTPVHRESEKEPEGEENKREQNTEPKIGELGEHNTVESGGNGTTAKARNHPSLKIGSSELHKILCRPPKGGEPHEGSKH